MTATLQELPGGVVEYLGTGRRKSSVARVRIKAGSGTITVNKRPFEEFFPKLRDQMDLLAPLEKTGQRNALDIRITVNGGGTTGQSGACKLGLARALKNYNTELEPILREHHFLTRDSRMKERKKCGLHGARRGTQFSKR